MMFVDDIFLPLGESGVPNLSHGESVMTEDKIKFPA
jgi:hypothetical protein